MSTHATYTSKSTNRTLTLRNSVDQKHVNIGIKDVPNASRTVGFDLHDDDAIDLAQRILRKLKPEALAAVPFSETPVGTYLFHERTGIIVQVVEYDSDTFSAYSPDGFGENEVWAVTSDGRAYPAYQDPKKPSWRPVEVDVKTAWQVKR